MSRQEQNPQLQVDALVAYGVPRTSIYEDKASGGSADRRGFNAMFRDLRQGDVLVVWKLDRLGRDLRQVLNTMERIHARGAELVVITQKIDTTTAHGKFMFNVLASMAQMERDLGVERTKAGLAAARARGRVGGRKPKLDDAARAEAWRLHTVEGMSGNQIARRFKASPSSIYAMLKERREKESLSGGQDSAE